MTSQHRRDDDARERGEGEPRRERHDSRLRDLARRILAERTPRESGDPELEREGYVPLEVAKDALVGILETGDRAKTEMVRMVAREVRHYLDELQLVEGLEHMLRNYTLEVHASLSLEPKADAEERSESKVEVEAKRKKSKSKAKPKKEEPEEEPVVEAETGEDDD
jgi:hypothetical protein